MCFTPSLPPGSSAPNQVQFAIVETEPGDRIGKLDLPYRKSADWLNFLASLGRRVQIMFTANRRDRLTVYFRADEQLYVRLNHQLNRPPF